MENNRGKLKKEELNLVEENSTELNSVEESKKTILVVDDEKPIVDILTYNLQKEGYATLEANDGEEAIRIATEQKPDLILLDIMLPKIDGLTVCKKLRHTLNVPILILSTKQFSVRELMTRVKANLRKAEVQVQNSANTEKPKKENVVIELGDLILDTERFEVKVRGKIIDLTLREFEVLKYLANQPGQVVTRETLLEKVWGYEYYGDIRTVDVTVRRIREKIEKDTSAPKILITKRGVGYYLATN